MRALPPALALVALLAAPAALAALPNECVTDTNPADGIRQVCHTLDLSSAHQGLPMLSSLAYFDVFYVWVGPGHCGNPVSDTCNGQPSGSDGITLPDGSGTIPTAGLFSTLYQETNSAGGLQRAGILATLPDRTVLV